MRKPTSKILVLLMALILMVSLLPATALATETTPSVNWSLTLCDRISANFYVSLEEADVPNTVVEFSLDGHTLTVNASDAVKKDDSYVFTVGLAAAQMTDEFEMAVVTNGSEVFSGTYSIRKYADEILKGDYAQRDKDMVVAMLNYGSAAQAYFKHNVDALAIDGYEAQVKTYTMPETVDGVGVEGQLDGIKPYGASLLFKSRTTIRFYFEVTGNVADYTFTDGNGKTFTPDKNGDYYSLDVTDINPQNLADIVTITVSKGDESVSVKYSALKYMVNKKNSTTENLPELVQAMYDYYQAAVSYQKDVNSVDAGHIGSHTSAPDVTDAGCTGFYFTLAANDAAYGDWNVEYKPASADCIKLIRNGETTSVGNAGAGTLVKLNETDYYLKAHAWMNGSFPLQVGDILVVEGAFTHYGTFDTIHIAKTYAEYTANGFLFYTVQGGTLQTHATNGGNTTGVYGSLAANSLPYDEWKVEYAPISADVIKLVRDGVTTSVGNTGAGTLVKYGAADYFLKYENWMNGSFPLQPFDYLIVDGVFANTTNGQSIRINTTYVYYDGATVVLSAEAPTVPTSNLFKIGSLSAHANTAINVNDMGERSGFYATAAASAAPYNGDWSLRYKALRADCVQFYDASEDKLSPVASTGDEMLVKFSETDYYFEGWTLGGTLANMAKGDYYIIEGEFYNAANDAYIVIDKTYVTFDGEKLAFSTNGPVFIFDAGRLSNHESGADSDGVYATMAENEAPFNADWSVEYTPVDAANYRVIRNGEVQNIGQPGRGTLVKISEDQYYLKHTGWCVNDFTANTDDVFIIEGHWQHKDDPSLVLNITKTYLYHDGTQWVFSEFEPMTVYDLDVLGTNATGKVETTNETLLYFSVALNGAPVGEYYPAKAANLMFVRDGVTHSVGTGEGTIVLDESGNHWLKLASWTVSGELLPLKETDYLIVEGLYIACTDDMGESAVQIPRSYVYFDGYAWVWSDSEPIRGIVAGPLLTDSGADGGEGVYVNMAANSAPTGVEYAPVEAENFQVIRKDGTVETIGQPGRGTLVKYTNNYYLKFLNKPWCIAEVEVTTDDIVVVSGLWQCTAAGHTDVYLNIAKSYVYFDGSAWVVSQTLPSIVNGGVMSAHDNGFLGTGVEYEDFFTLTANSLPVDENAEVAYTANAGVIKLVRAGVSHELSGYVVKFGETEYYMVYEGDELPMQDQDYLVVEGNFVNEDNGYTLNIDKSYIFLNDGAFIFTTTEPEIGFMVTNLNISGDPTHSGNGVEFNVTHDAHGATVNSDWSVEYTPISADAIKLVRNGETFSVGAPGQGTLVALNPTASYIKFVPWTFTGDKLPLQEGDKVIIDGLFQHNGGTDIMNIEYTEIVVGAGGTLTFPNAEIVYQVGVLSAHADGGSGTGFHATGLENNAPYNADNIWQAEYAPTSKECIQIIRNGETIYRENTGAGAIIKMGGSHYYVKFDTWIDSTNYPLQAGDVIIIEGDFVGTSNYAAAQGAKIHIDKTYVVYDGESFTFSDSEPEPVYQVGELSAHDAGGSGTGFHATGLENDAPYNADNIWQAEYAPTSKECIQIIRNGETIYRENTGAGAIVKLGGTGYYVKFDTWIDSTNYPLQAGDVIIIEGDFVGTSNYAEAEGVKIHIDKTYITYDGTNFTFVGESDKNIDAGHMGANSVGESDLNNGSIHFALASNGAPSDTTWAVRYNPVSADNVKLIRNGTTVPIGNTGAGIVVKVSDDLYAMAMDSWWWADYAPIQDGDVLVVEGAFTNASNGYTINIAKTYVKIVSIENDQVIFSKDYETEGGGAIELPVIPADMTIGMWNGSHHTFDDSVMQELVNAGITRIIGVKPWYAGDVNALLDRAQAKGISIILDLRPEGGTLWDGTLDNLVSHTGAYTLDQSILLHPALEGIVAFDEPWASDISGIATSKANFDNLKQTIGRSDLLFFVNLLPECSADDKFDNGSFWDDIFGTNQDYDENYVQEYLDSTGVTEYLSWDDYTLIHHTDSSYTGIRPEYFHGFEIMASKDIPLWYTMLSAGHTFDGQSYYYETPSQGELRWQMAVAMAFGVQNINHYTFTSHEDTYAGGCMYDYETNTFTDLFQDIKTVDNEFLAWDEIFMAYDYVGTRAQGVSGMTALENSVDLSSHGISSVSSSTGGVLVGVFENNGDKAYMITNAGTVDSGTAVHDGYKFTMSDTTVTLTFTDCSQVAVIDQGVIKLMDVTNGVVEIPVGEYEGVFVIPVA